MTAAVLSSTETKSWILVHNPNGVEWSYSREATEREQEVLDSVIQLAYSYLLRDHLGERVSLGVLADLIEKHCSQSPGRDTVLQLMRKYS